MNQQGRVLELTKLETEVGVLIRRARRVIGERARAVHPDLQALSYLMLGYIRDHGPLRASEVGCAFHVDKASVSRQVQHLIDLGFVDRQPDPDDGRATLLSVTEDGSTRLTAVAEARRRWLDERLGEWSESDLSDFVAQLGRYNDVLSIDADRD